VTDIVHSVEQEEVVEESVKSDSKNFQDREKKEKSYLTQFSSVHLSHLIS
jgi:hypothetical protein